MQLSHWTKPPHHKSEVKQKVNKPSSTRSRIFFGVFSVSKISISQFADFTWGDNLIAGQHRGEPVQEAHQEYQEHLEGERRGGEEGGELNRTLAELRGQHHNHF